MSAKILDGKALADTIKQELRQTTQKLKSDGIVPGLAVVLVGRNPASEIYVRNKRQTCSEVGIKSIAYDLDGDVSHHDLLGLIHQLNQNSEIHGILVQLPLPKQIDANMILEAIDPNKDVDGFHPYNLGRLAQNRATLRPCTPYGIMTLLERNGINVAGLNVTIVGASNIVGRPLALEFLAANATITVCHRQTKNLQEHIKNADLLVVAIGQRHVIQSDWIKKGAIVVDVGIHRLENKTITGDLDFNSAKERASWITPVPGGVGAMTVIMLMQNTIIAAGGFDK